jgi:hypothetical protein
MPALAGVYKILDEDPAPVAGWLPAATRLGSRP